ncbi:MAG: Gfo/Idh/MocA family oxidoreductase [Clostridia bacterium]|nr:Gfo/Idh/MocA family oxidoreductase [Clostridia bacterium]
MKTALIGCGAISGNHLIAIGKRSDVQIVALCDTVVSRAEVARAEFAPDARVYTDYRTMLDESKPDAVHIATPHHLHCEMTCEALSRGISVFLEKPICISEDEIERILKAEKESAGRVCVCFQNRLNPTVIAAKELVANYGGVSSARASVTWNRDEEYYRSENWRGKTATEGGGVLINQAIHELDLLIGFSGTPVTVSARTANHRHTGVIEVEDTAELLIGFENGAIGFFTATTAFGCDAPNFLELFCKNGKRITLLGEKLYVDGAPYDVSGDGYSSLGKECWGAGHVRLIDRFYEALESASPMPVTLSSAAVPLRVLLAAYCSSDRGTPVSI